MKKLNLVLAVGAIVIAGFTCVFGQTVSDEARRHFDRGAAAVEMAKSPADYEAAITEFKQAISLAPEWADAYYNLGKVQEQAEKFGDAITSLGQYLRLSPNASDAEQVKTLINKLQYKAENTLSTADIISVLTSLAIDEGKGYRSPWQWKGNCLPPDFHIIIRSKDEEYISVVSLVGDFNMGKMTYQVLKVDGPTVKFQWGITLRSIIVEKYETQLDVLSKSRVKVRAVVLKGQPGFEGIRGTGMIFECELSPPK